MSQISADTINESVVRRWKRYPVYKDSDVDWLGEIPAHWEVWKISHAYKRIGSGTTPATNDLSFYDGDILWVNTSELRENVITDTDAKLTECALKEHSVLSLYPPGTLLVAMYGATIGRLGILGVTACTNQACCALADPVTLDTKFTFYWLGMRRQEIIVLSSGGGQPNINQEKIRAIRIPAPSLFDQQEIASFLDRETAKIDTLIAKKVQLIQLLQEKRTALISHAVTKGLNPDAPMKDSGVEWLGEIPAHWEVKRLKYLAQGGLVNGLFKKKEQFGSGTKLVNVVNLYQNNFVVDFESLERVEAEQHELKAFEVLPGDIFFVRSSLKLEGVGASACIVEVPELTVFECHLVRVRPDQKWVMSKYLINYLGSALTRQRLVALAETTTMTTIAQPKLASLAVLVSPKFEQQAIASFLDHETDKIDALIAKIRTGIEQLKEYRTALISSAVTGKIDVCEEAAAA